MPVGFSIASSPTLPSVHPRSLLRMITHRCIHYAPSSRSFVSVSQRSPVVGLPSLFNSSSLLSKTCSSAVQTALPSTPPSLPPLWICSSSLLCSRFFFPILLLKSIPILAAQGVVSVRSAALASVVPSVSTLTFANNVRPTSPRSTPSGIRSSRFQSLSPSRISKI